MDKYLLKSNYLERIAFIKVEELCINQVRNKML